ncbi:MAG TPA: reverse transcriptase/maturase family protein, partial [Ktedonobacteraceae bacterium]|nr:reverse transcriptase/maturase family protein [Ktedonobacteraceae bacterium]
KLVQEVVRLILERIYEPIFQDSSHGFRSGRSPHTALECIRHQWTAVKWIIDMDIQGYFDTIDHDLLIRFLEKKIDDHRFIKLIKAMLAAGYMEEWTFHATYSGTPQGSIVSPILANVYGRLFGRRAFSKSRITAVMDAEGVPGLPGVWHKTDASERRHW